MTKDIVINWGKNQFGAQISDNLTPQDLKKAWRQLTRVSVDRIMISLDERQPIGVQLADHCNGTCFNHGDRIEIKPKPDTTLSFG